MKVIDGLAQDSRELQRKFGGCYIMARFKDKPEAVVICCNEFSNGCLDFRSTETDQRGLAPDDQYEIVQEFPTMGAINHKKECVVVGRRPIRQWRRGLHKDVLTEFSWESNQRPFLSDSRRMALALFRPWYPENVGEALTCLEKKNYRSVALNHRFWMLRGEDGIVLWYKKIPIAVLTDGKFNFFDECITLRQEALDLLGEAYV